MLFFGLAVLCSGVAAKQLVELDTSKNIDALTLQQLDKVWDDSKVSGDFEKVCSYRKPDGEPLGPEDDPSDLTTTWLDRQILFRTDAGALLPELSSPMNLLYYVTNSITYKAGTTRVKGGCKWGTGVDKKTRWQMKGNALYDVEEPKNFVKGKMEAGKLGSGTVDLTEWFAWHLQDGSKFALKLAYTEVFHNTKLPDDPKFDIQGKYQRYQTDLKCALYYRPRGLHQKAVVLNTELWSASMRWLDLGRTHEKRLPMYQCAK